MVSLSTLYAYQKTTYKVVLLFAPTPVRLVWAYPIMTLQIDSKRKTMGGDATYLGSTRISLAAPLRRLLLIFKKDRLGYANVRSMRCGKRSRKHRHPTKGKPQHRVGEKSYQYCTVHFSTHLLVLLSLQNCYFTLRKR